MEKVKNNITEVVFIIDKSGSMHSLESDTIGGFNSLIDEQKKSDSKVYVNTVFFSDYSQVIHDRVDIADVPHLTEKDYLCGGCTALLDAIGGAIHHIGTIYKYARPEDVPEKTMFVIITDGYENASTVYSSEKVKKMIQRKKDKYGWEFVFLGANIDAVDTAAHIGIEQADAVNYRASRKGISTVYRGVSRRMEYMRQKDCCCDSSWRTEIDENFASESDE